MELLAVSFGALWALATGALFERLQGIKQRAVALAVTSVCAVVAWKLVVAVLYAVAKSKGVL